MADNLPVARPASTVAVRTEERTPSVHTQLFGEAGFVGPLRSVVVTVTTAATLLPAVALTGRKRITVYNVGPGTVYLGGSDVTAADGMPLRPGERGGGLLSATALVYGIVPEDTAEVRVQEVK